MKQLFYIIIVLFCLSTTDSFGQVKIQKLQRLNGKDVVSVLCNVDTMIRKSNNSLMSSVYIVNNPSGSAGLSESDEISKNVLIAVSTIDDKATQFVYQIKNLLNPKIELKETANHNYVLYLEYGFVNSRLKKTLSINPDSVME